MKLSIIIPVFNEERTIAAVLGKISKLKIAKVEKEVIVVDDGSTDSSKSKIQNPKLFGIKFLSHKKNQGKGAAIRTGIEQSTGDYILIQDADLEYNPDDIARLLSPIQSGLATVVYGTRLNRLPNLARDERTLQFFVHYVGNRILSFLTSLLYGQWITDMETGYKLFPKKAALNIRLKARSFDFEPEITAKLLKSGYKIMEIPIATNPRGYAEGKKLNTIQDGLIALWTLIKYRMNDD